MNDAVIWIQKTLQVLFVQIPLYSLFPQTKSWFLYLYYEFWYEINALHAAWLLLILFHLHMDEFDLLLYKEIL